MKKLILVMGDLATGKSTFSDLIGQKFGVPVFHKDTIKEVLSETFPFEDRSDNLKLSKSTMDIMKHVFTAFAQTGTDLILESNYHENQLKETFKLADSLGYSYMSVILQGDIDILYERYMNRMKNENRHPVHLSTNFDIKENFARYVNDTRLSKIDGNVLKLDANTFGYQNDTKTFDIIEKFLRR